MNRWGYIAIAAAATIAVAAVALTPTTAVAAPSDLDVSPDCSRVTLKSRAGLTPKVGLAVMDVDPSDDMRMNDLLIAVMQKVVPQCTWPPAAGANPTIAGLSAFGAPVDEIRWIDLRNALGELTWGEVKKLGVLDFAPAPGTGADSRALAAGVAFMAAVTLAAAPEPQKALPLPNVGPLLPYSGIPIKRKKRT